MNDDLLNIGFEKIKHFTIMNSCTYDLGRRRFLSASCVGTPNENMCIYEVDRDNNVEITNLVCLHNWDYDGFLTIEKVKSLIEAITGKKIT